MSTELVHAIDLAFWLSLYLIAAVSIVNIVKAVFNYNEALERIFWTNQKPVINKYYTGSASSNLFNRKGKFVW